MKKTISTHNAKILQQNERDTEKSCNCRVKNSCPLAGDCQAKNIIYQATVVTAQPNPQTHTYIGLTSTTFKERFANHKKSMKHEKYQTSTSLSQFIWDLKEKDVGFDISWKIIDRAQPFNPITRVCNLCTLEKYYFLYKPNLATINKKEEIHGNCLHKKSKLLENT